MSSYIFFSAFLYNLPILEPYNVVAASNMTEWEKARERDEFSKAAKMFRPMSAMMSSRFVSGAMIDDDMEEKHIESGVSPYNYYYCCLYIFFLFSFYVLRDELSFIIYIN